MRIHTVTARAFGPLVGETLILTPGMTVVHGGNESAKSSWHAATYAALCGRRRARGRQTTEDQRFADRHRPWDRPEEWGVSCILSLDDGRRIELRHDLAGMVDCRATDLALGRDVSAEIMHDGAPDGSRWLGLDRRSFAATGSVTQAELLSVLDAAGSLQEHLQRAAANANTDSTAAQALECLQAFQREHVGSDRSNSTRPLRRAKDRLVRAEEHLNVVQRLHEDYLQFVAEAQECREAARAAADEVQTRDRVIVRLDRLIDHAADAARKQEIANRLVERLNTVSSELSRERHRLERARQLHSVLGGKAPDDGLIGESTARLVGDAISAWKAAPAAPVLTGPTSAELAAMIAELPEPPDGDTAVHDEVRAATSEFEKAAAVLEEHLRSRPAESQADTEVDTAVRVGPARLRELAQAMTAPLPEMPDGLLSELDATAAERSRTAEALEQARRQHGEAQRDLRDAESARAAVQGRLAAQQEARVAAAAIKAAATKRRRTELAGAGVLSLAGGAGLLAAGQSVVSAVSGILGVALLVVAALRRRARPNANTEEEPAPELAAAEQRLAQASQRVTDSDTVVRRLEAELASAEGAAAAAQARQDEHQRAVRTAETVREKTAALCAELDVPGDAERLATLAAQAEHAIATTEATAHWTERFERLRAGVDQAERLLRDTLVAHGTDGTGGSIEAMRNDYEDQCRARAEQAAAASQRAALLQQLEARREREHNAAQAEALRAAALTDLVAAAEAAAVRVDSALNTDDVTGTAWALTAALTQWQHERATAQAALDEQRSQWSTLQTLLDGAGLDDLAAAVTTMESRHAQAETEAHTAEEQARTAAAKLAEGAEREGIPHPDTVRLTGLRERARQALGEARTTASYAADCAAAADGALQERTRALPSVPEAEEGAAAARRELDRVEQLDIVLSLTQQFLHNAQERVHRDIAPVLAGSLKQWLPRITGGRYVDAIVDPSDLRVRVCGDQRTLRHSERLSRGTAEQIYLLLRIALASHLAVRDESCPLLLDDVTVQSDAERTRRLLELLHELSAHQQVILFAQEQLIVDWARDTLTGPADSVVALRPVASQ
ncbi:hypothetical protein NGB36_28140 [Streptomyces sp. RB6PN25]|uniref:Rad50/SbcC-type AAA domain-containing protein n=1 Tax=Streptomyces humicola TaxID=2953240 RepID=A0ABT1Q344_9ACTN|nr:hypothetical protein [Streptomyces humicola]MCQ4084347.1 hypothetical protein [Streptomyces humicola]